MTMASEEPAQIITTGSSTGTTGSTGSSRNNSSASVIALSTVADGSNRPNCDNDTADNGSCITSINDDCSILDDDYMICIRTDDTLPSLGQCYDFVAADPCCGAVSSFVGITRNNFESKEVLSLSYEAYIPMAMKELQKLCIECKTVHYASIRRIAAVHIIGDCPVGHASVILACSSPHRSDAIHCCEYLIHQLKARIPIWKKERYANDPNAIWKENIEWFQQYSVQESHRSYDHDAVTNTEQQQHPTGMADAAQLQSRRTMVRQRNANNIDHHAVP